MVFVWKFNTPMQNACFLNSFSNCLQHIQFLNIQCPKPKRSCILDDFCLIKSMFFFLLSLFQDVFKSLILSSIFDAFLLLNAGPLKFSPRRVCLPKIQFLKNRCQKNTHRFYIADDLCLITSIVFCADRHNFPEQFGCKMWFLKIRCRK